jgi:hypothetical protein
MDMVRLVYASRPFGFDDSILNGILIQARHNNSRRDITGALICRADVYLQLLEGPEAAVKETYSHIARDDRHLEVKQLLVEPATDRMFPGWAMRDDPARSWMWTKEQIAAGAISRASPKEILAIFARLNATD